MPESSEISEWPEACLGACLDTLDICVDTAGAAAAAACYHQYSRCANGCDGIEHSARVEGGGDG
jgi:hypothetical protein